MNPPAAEHRICVCMGSSCFSRGNRDNLVVIRDFLAGHGLQAQVELTGCLCMNNCRRGPTVTINGERHDRVDTEACVRLLTGLLADQNGRNRAN